MDNRQVDVTSEGPIALRAAVKLAAANHSTATHYALVKIAPVRTYYARRPDSGRGSQAPNVVLGDDKIIVWHSEQTVETPDGCLTLILLWGADRNAIPLPYPLKDDEAMADFVGGWLNTTVYPKQPDHDGDNAKGWRVFTEGWGHVAGYSYAICGAQPAWAMYGK